jgi:hypothetical protein
MAKRYVSNDTDRTIFVGGVLIPAGEGREVDEQFLPPADDAPRAESLADPQGDGAGQGPSDEVLAANIADLLGKPLKQLVPLLAEASDETLAALQSAEVATATPRVTLLNAIAALQLQRAEARTGATSQGLGTGA